MKRGKIYTLIDMERSRQDLKWGENREQHNMIWLTILMEEVGEVAQAILKKDWENMVAEIIQCLAVGVAWLEMKTMSGGDYKAKEFFCRFCEINVVEIEGGVCDEHFNKSFEDQNRRVERL